MYIGYHTELAESSPVYPENLLRIHSEIQQSNRWSAKNPVGVPEDNRRCSNIVPPYSGGSWQTKWHRCRTVLASANAALLFHKKESYPVIPVWHPSDERT